MVKVVGVAFKEVGKIYWFDPNNIVLSVGDKVVVETVRGLELGLIVKGIHEVNEKDVFELKPVLRIASPKDLKRNEDNERDEEESLRIAKDLVKQNNLQMKLLSCEFTLDHKKIIIYYNSDSRVDFRDLLKDLAVAFRLRIELRQIGAREGAKIVGGLGVCGQEVCCKRHLREFSAVSMKMAKEQDMALSASKVAGICGKLMCCIGYECDFYREQRKRIPGVGDMVNTPSTKNSPVIGVNYLQELIKTRDSDGNTKEWKASEVIRVKEMKIKAQPDDDSDDVVDD